MSIFEQAECFVFFNEKVNLSQEPSLPSQIHMYPVSSNAQVWNRSKHLNINSVYLITKHMFIRCVIILGSSKGESFLANITNEMSGTKSHVRFKA